VKARAVWAVATLSLAAGLIVARPLPSELTQGLPVGARQPVDVPVLSRMPSDTLQLYYQLWLVRDGLLGPTPLFTDPYQFRINGPRGNLTQTFLPLALPFTVLSVFGLHAAYNLLVLLSFPATALAAYGLARQLTGAPGAALVAGVGFALLPARLDPLFGGHPAGFALALVPAALWGLDVALTRGRLAGGVAGGLAVLALAMLEPQYTYITLGILVAHVAMRAWVGRTGAWAWMPFTAFVLFLAAAIGWVFMLRQAFVTGSIADVGRGIKEVRLFSPGLGILAQLATYGGPVLALLTLIGLTARGRAGDGGLRLLYGAVLASGVVLIPGPTLPRLPFYEALHRWLPFFAMIRNPRKLELLVAVGSLVLAALGARAVLSRLAAGSPRRRRRLMVAGALTGLVLVTTPPWHGVAVARFGDSPVYEALRRSATRVLYLPVWPGDSAYSSLYLYAITRTRVPAVNGYSPFVPRRYLKDVFESLEPLNVGDVGLEEASALRRLGVSHVVVDRAVFPPQVSGYPSAFTIGRLRGSPALALELGVDPLWLFRVTGEGPAERPGPTSPVGLFYEAEWQNHESGAVVNTPEASGGAMMAARPGLDSPGFLTFGPYRPLPAGKYAARFRVRGAGLRVDVAADRGRRIIAERTVDVGPEWTTVVLPFVVERGQPLEFRAAWDGRAPAAVDWVLVVAADRPDPEWTYEVEALPHKLGERPDPQASGGWAGYADPGESQRTALVSGPVRLFPAGRYRLAVRLRVTAAGLGPLVRLAVTEPMGPTLATREVEAGEVPPGAYREVTLDFALDRPRVLEFPIAFLGDVGVLFDRVTVTPQ
jgi:hypothetical protein